MREIVVCGEALVDVVQQEQAPGATLAPLQPALGGGPFNVAITLGRLGSAVSLLSAVSTDNYGEAIVGSLQGAGVGTAMLQRRREPTSLALATIADNGSAQYSFYVEGTADRTVADPGSLAPTVAAATFGTLSLVLEPGATVYENLMRRCHAERRLVVLDPNIRSVLIPDADAYRRRFRSWMPSVDVVKLSDEDAAWLGEGAAGSAVKDWLADGVAAVITTAGASGITVTTTEDEVTVPARNVDVVDTIGAGDSVLGGLVHQLDRLGALSPDSVRSLTANQWREVAEFAAHVAAVTVSRRGADPPWAGELRSD
ncbi:carbohydrate kinase family protein [Gordonia amicalis]|uniref:carbohydrate kinase family protein n=1 Tax=Gordonia amicalis TaxID=89053 RepID=UPI0002A62527|nr:carbohydrate kinase [Gordonia amicalis]MBA5848326.1 carbohydrate kinase [Gordonia amicalis]MCZ0911972.1 carbohydrate kinase [Gordonia amicalis]MDV7174685.1 carbohydrate kinase [Gordonia amicalis]NKX78206.1 carbohydrate kinase [Gordonia amicalis]GAC53030.1 putative fructokinase [Gordonia amicalis NBRC 100051 = JCM 11271]